MIVLGIDSGSRGAGLGLIRVDGRRLVYLNSAQWSQSVLAPRHRTLPERMASLRAFVGANIAPWCPDMIDAVGYEKVGGKMQSALTSYVSGMALGAMLAGLGGLSACAREINQATVKAAVAHGRADKAQMQRAVIAILGLPRDTVLGDDEADALAVAIATAHAGRNARQAEIA